jgi:hypothetical protein
MILKIKIKDIRVQNNENIYVTNKEEYLSYIFTTQLDEMIVDFDLSNYKKDLLLSDNKIINIRNGHIDLVKWGIHGNPTIGIYNEHKYLRCDSGGLYSPNLGLNGYLSNLYGGSFENPDVHCYIVCMFRTNCIIETDMTIFSHGKSIIDESGIASGGLWV